MTSASAPAQVLLNSDESDLWRQMRGSSPAARERLFALHAPFARAIATKRWRERTSGDLDLQEMRQFAYVGLLEAIDRFDPDRGVPFRGYAARRISGSVLDGLAHASELREQIGFRSRLRAERIRSLAAADTEAMSSEAAMRALSEIATGLAVGFMLDAGLAVSDDAPDRSPSAYDGLAWKETIQRLGAAIDELSPREKSVVQQHYMQGVSFDTIAALMGLSKGRISQIHKAAVTYLRSRLGRSGEFALHR